MSLFEFEHIYAKRDQGTVEGHLIRWGKFTSTGLAAMPEERKGTVDGQCVLAG